MEGLLDNWSISRNLRYFSVPVLKMIWDNPLCLLWVFQIDWDWKISWSPFYNWKKKIVFGFLKDIHWKHINQWSNKHLSKAGKEVLLKSCALAIASYSVSVYLLPSTLEDKIQKWWTHFGGGSKVGSRKWINWLSWEKLTMKKEYEGMGLRHLYGFNLVMLGKRAWKLSTDSNAIVTKVVKAKYIPN